MQANQKEKIEGKKKKDFLGRQIGYERRIILAHKCNGEKNNTENTYYNSH